MSCYPDGLSLAQIRAMEGEDPEDPEEEFDVVRLVRAARRKNHPTTKGTQ